MSGITKEQQKEKARLEKNRKISETLAKEKPNQVERLRQAFAIGANVEIACRHAGISKDTYYKWIKKDKKLSDEFEAIRDHPILKSLKAVVEALDQPQYAFRYLEKKLPQEYGERTTITHEGEVKVSNPEQKEELTKMVKEFNENLRTLLTKKKTHASQERETTNMG